jgi:hypothetical protein
VRRRLFRWIVGGVAGLAVVGLAATVASTAPAPRPRSVPAVMEPDTGAGEMLIVVVGGVYDSQETAEAANAQMPFGDVQGYYVVPADQFQGFGTGGSASRFALVSAFRTEEGAAQFQSFARALGYPAWTLANRVRSLGGAYAGLGQEAAPDGIGPLTRPIPASLP